jgi:hypothetical protein
MDNLNPEIKLHEFYKYLSYDDIINLSLINKEFNFICCSNFIWKHLLFKDFNINCTQENIRKIYLLYHHTLDHYSKFYPIITYNALTALINNIPVSEWDKFDQAIREYRRRCECDVEDLILTIQDVGFFINAQHELFDNNIITSIYQYIDDNLKYPDLEQMMEDLRINNGKNYFDFICRPAFIFVNKKLIEVNHDYELAVLFLYNTIYNTCFEDTDQIKDRILAFLK